MIKFISMAKKADARILQKTMQELLSVSKVRKKEELARKAEEIKEKRQQEIENRKKNKSFAFGLKPSVKRSSKPAIEQRKETKV